MHFAYFINNVKISVSLEVLQAAKDKLNYFNEFWKMGTKNSTNNLFIQILKEFWIQTILSAIWAYVNVKKPISENVLEFITLFGTSFFLISWFIGQYYRVKKQQKIESNFIAIQERLLELISGLGETHNYITGGDSWLYLECGLYNVGDKSRFPIRLTLRKNGVYPVHDVKIYIEEKIFKEENNSEIESLRVESNRFIEQDLGTVINSIKLDNVFIIKKLTNQTHKFEVRFKTRNGEFYQLFHFQKINEGVWTFATKVISLVPTSSQNLRIETLLEVVPEEFPKEIEAFWTVSQV